MSQGVVTPASQAPLVGERGEVMEESMVRAVTAVLSLRPKRRMARGACRLPNRDKNSMYPLASALFARSERGRRGAFHDRPAILTPILKKLIEPFVGVRVPHDTFPAGTCPRSDL